MTKGEPIVRAFFAEMNRQHCSYYEMERKSGVNLSTLRGWRVAKFTPQASLLEACFNVLGRTLTHKEKE